MLTVAFALGAAVARPALEAPPLTNATSLDVPFIHTS
jgi:hypothetical protein